MLAESEAVCGPKFNTFWDDIGDPLQLSTHLTDCLYRVPFRRYRPLSCEVVQKGGFWAPDLDTPVFGHTFSNRSYFRACGRFWLGSIQRARGLGGEKKKEERKKTPGKI